MTTRRLDKTAVLAVLTVLVVIALAILGFAIVAPNWVGGGAPFQEREVQPQLSALHVRPAAGQAPGGGQQVVSGAIDVSGHAVAAGNSYLLAVVDNPSHVALDVTSVSDPTTAAQVTEQTDPAVRGAFAKYDFLRVVNADRVRCLRVPATPAGQRLSFRAALPAGAAPVNSSDLTVGLIFTGPKNEIWWASHWS